VLLKCCFKRVCLIGLCLGGFAIAANSQLWTGSLGDPVVNVTFGHGGNPGPKLPAGQTSFTFSGRSCPAGGEYSLLNLTFSCFENSWHTLSGDHTPNDGGGYYMLVNASGGKADFFVQKVSNLCPNTRYQFAAWIKNALRSTACDNNGIKPNLTFTVENTAGAVLYKYNSNDIATSDDPDWKQYGMTFTTSAAPEDMVLRITNTAVSGCGNALALDDITLSPCGPEIKAIISNNNAQAISVCEGSTASHVLHANYSSEYKSPVLQWQQLGDGLIWSNIPGANAQNFVRPASATGEFTYRVLIQDAAAGLTQCNIASNQVSVSVLHAPFVQATNYVYGCLGGDVTLQASGATKYQWVGPNGYVSTDENPVLPTVTYNDAGLYKVTGITDLGCVNSDSTILKVYPNATAVSSQGGYICEGAATQLTAGGGFRYQWEPATALSSDTAANPVANPVEDTRYVVKVTNQYGCSDTTSIPIYVWKKPVANAGPDLKTRLGFPVTLKGSISGTDVSWSWSPATGINTLQSLNPVVSPPQTSTYRLQVTSPHGCGTSTDDVVVKVFDKILIPNAFSPNGDGINDTWYIEPLYMFEQSMTEVYNRYGQMVFRSKGYNQPWNGTRNGTNLPAGTYYYVIDLRVNREPKLTGSVTILR
jgi:gliding motility-associated-like protein